MREYEILKSENVFKGKVLNISCDEISLPDGNSTSRETVLRGNAAAIVPVDNDGNIIFVKQYRHAVKDIILEIPAGMLEKGEDPAIAGARELEEETSFKAGKMTHLVTIYPAVGFCTEKIYIYVATDLEKGEFNFDSDEFITIEKYSLEKALNLIFDGTIKDGKTVSAILAYNHYINSQK